MIMLIVAFDISAFVCYITRFTEENFATLIALIFIQKSFQKVGAIGKSYPLNPGACFCKPSNQTHFEEYGIANEGDFFTSNQTGGNNFPCTVNQTLISINVIL